MKIYIYHFLNFGEGLAWDKYKVTKRSFVFAFGCNLHSLLKHSFLKVVGMSPVGSGVDMVYFFLSVSELILLLVLLLCLEFTPTH